MNNKNLTKFGAWWHSNPRHKRREMMQGFTEAGISPNTVWIWAHEPRLPRVKNIEIINQVTGQDASGLFPY